MQKNGYNSIGDRMCGAFQSAGKEINALLGAGKQTSLPEDYYDIPQKMIKVFEADNVTFWWSTLKKHQDTMTNLLSSAQEIVGTKNLFDQVKDDPIYFKYCEMCLEVASLLTRVSHSPPKNTLLDRLQEEESHSLNELILNGFFGDYKAKDLKDLCEKVKEKVEPVLERVVNKEDRQKKHQELKNCLDEMEEIFEEEMDLSETDEIKRGLTRLYLKADDLMRWLLAFGTVHDKQSLAEDRETFDQLSSKFFAMWSKEIDSEMKQYNKVAKDHQSRFDTIEERSIKIKACDTNVDYVGYYISIAEQMRELDQLSKQLGAMQGLSKGYYEDLNEDLSALESELAIYENFSELQPYCKSLAKVGVIDENFRVMLTIVSKYWELLDEGECYQDASPKKYKNEAHKEIAELLKGTGNEELRGGLINVRNDYMHLSHCKAEGAKDIDINATVLFRIFLNIDADFNDLYQKYLENRKGKEEQEGAKCVVDTMTNYFETVIVDYMPKKQKQMIEIVKLVHAAHQEGSDANTVSARFKQNSQKHMKATDEKYMVDKDDAWYKKVAKYTVKGVLKASVGAYAGTRSVVTKKTDVKGSLWFPTVWKWYHEYRHSVYKELRSKVIDSLKSKSSTYSEPVRDFEAVEDVKVQCQMLLVKLKNVNDEIYYDAEKQKEIIEGLLEDVHRFIDETRRLILRIIDRIAKILKVQEKSLPNDLIALRMAMTYKEKLEEISQRHESFALGGNDIESRVKTMVNAQQTRIEIKQLKDKITDRFDLLSEKSIFSINDGEGSKTTFKGIVDNTKLGEFSITVKAG